MLLNRQRLYLLIYYKIFQAKYLYLYIVVLTKNYSNSIKIDNNNLENMKLNVSDLIKIILCFLLLNNIWIVKRLN